MVSGDLYIFVNTIIFTNKMNGIIRKLSFGKCYPYLLELVENDDINL